MSIFLDQHLRIAARRNKLKMRFGPTIEVEIARTEERLLLLRDIHENDIRDGRVTAKRRAHTKYGHPATPSEDR